jgi:hypothetical protein
MLLLERATDLQRAFHGLFRAFVKNQRHPVAGGDLDQSGRGFGVLKLLGRANGLSQFINRRALIVNRKLGVTNNVDEQDMRDLELDLFLDLNGHARERPTFLHRQLFAFQRTRRDETRQKDQAIGSIAPTF